MLFLDGNQFYSEKRFPRQISPARPPCPPNPNPAPAVSPHSDCGKIPPVLHVIAPLLPGPKGETLSTVVAIRIDCFSKRAEHDVD